MRRKKWLAGVPAFLLFIILLLWGFRNTLLQSAFNKVSAQYLQNRQLNVSAGNLHFTGLATIEFTGLCIQPAACDTLLTIDSGLLQLKLLKLLTGQISFSKINLGHINVTAYNLPGRNNISGLWHGAQRGAAENGTGSYKARAMALQKKMRELLQLHFNLNGFNLQFTDSTGTEKLYLPQLYYNGHQVTANLLNLNNKDTLLITASVYSEMNGATFTIKSTADTLQYLPFATLTQLKCRFRQISGGVRWQEKDDKLEVKTNVGLSNFHLNHWRLAKQDVTINSGNFKGHISIGDEFIRLDSPSTLQLANTTFHLFSSYQAMPDKIFELRANMPETPADTFFNCLPGGMFTTLQGISCTGTLAYHLRFMINTSQPDSLIFTSSLKRKNFTLRHYGNENYSRINDAFMYDAYSKGVFMRRILVGPGNPAFTALPEITPQLPLCVLQSEDPSFMQHNGFLAESFRESIIKNYKEKRFARGGSTISMQLVKNVFLSSNKTVSRKIEEALIVYLIENLHLVSKQRMLEVYLNVIEWGPNIYGIGEAANFYFGKTPAHLTLPECVFLACIIPNPRSFKYQFKKDGTLQPWFTEHFNLLLQRMTERGLVSGYDTNIPPVIELKGPARAFILPEGTE